MNVKRIQEVANAISDEMRIRILLTLDSGEPRRYTDLMKDLDLNITTDSSKFAYHVGVLVEAGLIEKFEEQYRLTHGGAEILSTLVKVTDEWSRLEYQDSLRRLSGGDLNKRIWSSTFILSSLNFIVFSLFEIRGEPNPYAYMLMAFGILLFSLGAYWQYELRTHFDDIKLDRFQASVQGMLGENGMIVYMIIVLGQLGLVGMVVFFVFLMRGTWVVNPASLSIFFSCVLLILAGIFFSVKLSIIWKAASSGREVPNYGRPARFTFYIVAGALISLGIWKLIRGEAGGGIGILGASAGVCNGVRKFLNTGSP